MCLGFTVMGSAGWLLVVKQLFVDKDTFLGILTLISSILWTINLVYSFYLMIVAIISYQMQKGTKHINIVDANNA